MTYEAKVILLKNVRLSHPHLFKAQPPQEGEGEPKYNGSFIIDPSTPSGKANIKLIKNELKRAYKEGYPDKVRLKGTCLKAQDDDLIESDMVVTATEGKQRDEYKGMYLVSASEKKRPIVINRAKEPVTESDDVVYAGCYVNVSIMIWVQGAKPEARKYGCRLNANLRAVQFYKDGEAFGASSPVDVDNEFEDFDDDDEFDDDDDVGF